MGFTYQDIPQSGNVLAMSQSDIEHNFQYLAASLGTYTKSGDHQINVNGVSTNAFEGRHLQVALKNRSGGAPTVAGLADSVDSLLYSSNGNVFFGSATGAGAFQLTTYNSAANFGANPNGWTFLPGGLIMQYGTASTAGTTGTVSFSFMFPFNVLSLQLTIVSGLASRSINIINGSVTTSQFQWNSNASGGGSGSLYYLAIGN